MRKTPTRFPSSLSMASPMADGEGKISEEFRKILELVGVMQSATAGEDKRVISSGAASRTGDLSSILNGVLAEATLFAQRQHAQNGIAEKTPDPGRMQTAKGIARTGGKSVAQDKRTRAANWEEGEKALLLVLKLRILVIIMLHSLGLSTFKYGKSWAHYVSDQLERAVKSCQGQWDSLLKSRNAICDHESKIRSGTISHVSFWKMNEQQKHTVNEERRISKLELLPQAFPREWYELMEIILQIDAVKKNPSFKIVGGNLSSTSTANITSTITDTDDSPRWPLDAIRSQPSSSHDRDSMGPPLPLVSTQAGKQRTEDEVLALSYEHEFSLLISFITKRVEDEVKTQILPFWRGQEENEQKHCLDRLVAIEEDKLALKRKKMALAEGREVEEQKHRRRLLDLKEEKLQLERLKILHPEAPAYTIPRCDRTNISCEAPVNGDVASAHSQPGTNIPFNPIDSTFAPGQQPNFIPTAELNEDDSSLEYFLVSSTNFSISQDSSCLLGGNFSSQ